MEKPSKRALGYLRISSLRQVDNESPATQKQKILEYAGRENIEIIGWFFDEAKSGKNTDRKELNNLLETALSYKSGEIDYVIVYKMNRASRDINSYILKIRAVLHARGISVRSATEHFDDSSIGQFTEILHVLLGQIDNENKKEYTKDNMRSLAHQGYWQHPPIIGYDTVKIPNEQGKPRPSLSPNSMAPKVKQVLERFSQGDITKAELARYAISIGLKSRYGKHLSEDSINRLLKSPEYAGFIHDSFTNYKPIEGKHQPIISREVFTLNQALLYGKNTRKNEVHNKQNKLYPLRGMLLCQNCNNKLYASAPRTGNGGRSPRYHCSRPACKGKSASIKAEKVHNAYVYLLQQIKPSESLTKLYKQVLVREANQNLSKLNQRIRALREELDNIASTRNDSVRKFVEGGITLDEKSELINSLDSQKLVLKMDLEALEQQQLIRESDIEHCLNLM